VSVGLPGEPLTLARILVELHGGSINAHSEGPGRGSEFVVRSPVAAPGLIDPLARSAADTSTLAAIAVTPEPTTASKRLE
jgi:hypothetical protein